MRLHRIALLTLGALIVALGALARSKKADNWEARANRAKADYIFLEAQNAYNQENYSLYGRLLQRAFDTDSSDLGLGAELGQWLAVCIGSDRAKGLEGLQRMRRYYEANPSDYYTGISLANIYANLGMTEQFLEVNKMLCANFPEKNNVALQLAESYLRRSQPEDFDSAMTIYRRLERGYDAGISNSITSYIIRAYMLRNDTAAVLRELDKVYRAAPHDVPTLLTVGGAMLELERPDSALRYFNEAKAIEPDNGGVVMGLLGYYDATGDSTAFLNTLRRAVANQELDPEEKFVAVRGYIQENHSDSSKFATCSELCESYISNNPGTPEIHTLYAGLLASTDRLAEAADQLSFAIALMPSNKDIRQWQLSLLYNADRKQQATELAEEYAGDFPGEIAFPRFVAAQFYEQGEYAKAVDRFKAFPVDSLKTEEEKSDYYATLGDFTSKLEPRSDSYPYYIKAIELNPLNDMAMNNLAYFYSLDGNPDDLLQAENYSAISIRHQPDNPTFLDTYAWIKFKQKDFQAARRYIDQVLELMAPETAPDTAAMTEIYIVADSTDTSLAPRQNIEEEFEELEEIDGDSEESLSADVLDHAGDIYFMTGEPERALQFWERALALDPENELLKKKVKYKTYFYQ